MFSANDVIRMIMTWNFGTESVAKIVWHYFVDVAGTATFTAWLDHIHTQLQTAWANIDGYITSDLSGSTLEMLRWDFANNRWDGLVAKGATGMAGSNGGDYAAHGNAVLVKIFTELARRQSRKYIPGIVEANVTGGFLDSLPLAAMVDFADDLDTPLALTGGAIQYCTFNTTPASPLFETASMALGSVGAEATGSYQRRRKPGVGLT